MATSFAPWILSAALVAGLALPAAPALLVPGFYWKHQSIPGPQGEWLALVVGDRAELRPARLQTRRDRELPDAFTVESREQPEALLFLQGLPAPKNPIPMAIPKEAEKPSPDRRVHAYDSKEWGPLRIVVRLDRSRPGPEAGSFQASLALHAKDRRQTLILLPQRPGSETLEPLFVGDLDGDRKPDVVVKETLAGGFLRVRLYLSTAAQGDEMVRQAVHLTHGGD